jgi:hypothetical protein
LDAWWVALLRRQQSDGFPDLVGGEASISLPISDRLVSQLIAERIPPSIPVREFELVAYADDVIAIRVRLTKPALLPPIRLRLAIERQPELPVSPVFVLALTSQPVAGFAATALAGAGLLPEGVRFDRGRFFVDIATILRRWNAADALKYLTELRINTTAHRLIVQARAALTP